MAGYALGIVDFRSWLGHSGSSSITNLVHSHWPVEKV